MIYQHKKSGDKYYVVKIPEVTRDGYKFQYAMTHVDGDGADHYNDTATIESDYICIDDTSFMNNDDPRINERIQFISTLGCRIPSLTAAKKLHITIKNLKE